MSDRKFYNCDCGWSDNKLAYADENGRGQPLMSGNHQSANWRPYAPNQGHCPRCGVVFQGCFNFVKDGE